jgi:hypothetical protein
MNRFRRNMLLALGSLPVGFATAPVFAQSKVPQPGTDYRLINPAAAARKQDSCPGDRIFLVQLPALLRV